MKADKLHRAQHDKAVLLSHGYIIKEFTPYHWHVRRKGSRRAVSVWPTAGKWVELGAYNVQRYGNVLEAVNAVFNDPAVREEEAAQGAVDALRAGGLDYLKQK